MPIIKLVCQGCGANLDALDTSRIVECGYCHTRNQIKPTVYQEPPKPPPQIITSTPPQFQVQPIQHTPKANAGCGPLIAGATVVPIIIGGIVAYLSMKGVDSLSGEVRGQGGGQALVAEGQPARRYRWESERPLVIDVNGDQQEDVIGLIQTFEQNSNIMLVAVSGADWKLLWEVSLGDRANMPGQPEAYFLPDQKLALFALGASLHAYDVASGQRRWIGNLPDHPKEILGEGQQLWVISIDESMSTVQLADGKVATATGKASKDARPVRKDEGYDLIPDNRQLDLDREQFEGLSIQTAFCPPELLAYLPGRGVWDPIPCTHPHGLAWAAREKGTQVPFLVGYDPSSQKELWRQQLGTAGSLETIDTGFGQPRAEFVDADAIVSFVPSGQNNARIRRISLADGSTKWEAELQRTSTENVDGMVVGKERVVVNYGGRMHVLDLADGRELERLGGG